uniref:Uncharacterized protein n=1 Tax=Rhizophora mucronata TaxID=61149 RepID=A0A2P2P144_RHIMU
MAGQFSGPLRCSL